MIQCHTTTQRQVVVNLVDFRVDDPLIRGLKRRMRRKSVAVLFQKMKFGTRSQKFRATRELRKILSTPGIEPPIEEVVSSGLCPMLVEFLKWDDPLMQLEAAWSITNIVAGKSDSTDKIVESGCIPLLFQLLKSGDNRVREQVVWALGNIAGDNINYRDLLLQMGLMIYLLDFIHLEEDICVLKTTVWTISNLCRTIHGHPEFSMIAPAVPILTELVQEIIIGNMQVNDRNDLLENCYWCFSDITNGTSERIQVVIESGIVKCLVESMSDDQIRVKTAAVRTICNIVSGTNRQAQEVINCGALPKIHLLLHTQDKKIREEVCWAISNLTAGSTQQVQAVINARLIPDLLRVMEDEQETINTKQEATIAISNIITSNNCDQTQLNYILQLGVIKALCVVLLNTDMHRISMLETILESIKILLEKDNQMLDEDQENKNISFIKELGAFEIVRHIESNMDLFGSTLCSFAKAILKFKVL